MNSAGINIEAIVRLFTLQDGAFVTWNSNDHGGR